MAARSGAGTGVVVSLVVFVLSTVFLLVLTIVFYAKQQEANEKMMDAQASLDRFATREQRNRDDIKAIVQTASATQKSVVRQLMEEREGWGRKVANDPNVTIERVDSVLEPYGVGPGATVITALSDKERELRAARQEVDSLKQQVAALNSALADKEGQRQQAVATGEQAVDGVTGKIREYATSFEQYRQSVDDAIRMLEETKDSLESDYADRSNSLESTIDSLRNEVARQSAQISQFQAIIDSIRVKGKTPELLVDGHILDVVSGQDQVFINRGRVDHVTLGMTFEVYDDPSVLQPDEFGSLPRGKASIQVIKIGETTSTAKITRSVPGRPVVRNNIIANAIYDPEKVFTFLVHGKFDLDGDGLPSDDEADYVRTLVREWGGKVVDGDELRGDLDFLVLGVQPPKPPALRPGATQIETEIWIKNNQIYEKYMQLWRDAMSSHIPVINHNRFLILIGHTIR